MEPVIFPRSITAVNRADRITRATPRDDRGHDGAFQRHLRRHTTEPAPPDEAGPEPAAGVEPPAAAQADAPGESAPRQINIRV